MSNIFNILITKIKSKKSSINNNEFDEYAFSLEEIDNLQEENKQKIKNLKEDKIGLKLETNSVLDTLKLLEKKAEEKENINENQELEILKEDTEEIIVEELTEKTNEDTIEEVIKELEQPKEEKVNDQEHEISKERKPSFVNLTKEEQDVITNCFKELNLKELDKDILEAKDILNHNYNISYPDNAAKFIHNIRKKYETLITYLIGFNNEKKGDYNKIIFSNKLDNEWNFLENYIKLLEKMRSFIK